MHSMTVWQLAKKPDYETNVDKLYPYSELPYLGEHNLLKIPVSLNNLIQHVNYWGEGRVQSGDGISGFSNCYNINHQYQLVSSGPDRDRKIPNRIPVASYSNCDTSAYIKDNSVVTVTVAAEHLNNSCAKDIARIINNDHGTVVVYGADANSQEILDLAVELRKKGLFAKPDSALPNELQGLTFYDSHVAFVKIIKLKENLHNFVITGDYEAAVKLSKLYEAADGEDSKAFNEIVTKLISDAPRKVMSYAYKLWHGEAKDIVTKYFPSSFHHIFNQRAVTIINKQYDQPLKLDSNTDTYGDRLVWGGNPRDFTSTRVSWKVIPTWTNSGVTFKLYNIDREMYLKLDVEVDYVGDRRTCGSTDSDNVTHKYYLEPLLVHGNVLFYIINLRYDLGLKLEVKQDDKGDRLLWGHNGSVYDGCGERGKWFIEAWKSA